MSYFAQINKLINWIKTTEYKFDSKSDYIKYYNGTKSFTCSSSGKPFDIVFITKNNLFGKNCIIKRKRKSFKQLTFSNNEDLQIYKILFSSGFCDTRQYKNYLYIIKLLNKKINS